MCALKERKMELGPYAIACLISFSIGSIIFLVWLFKYHTVYFIMSLSIVLVIVSALLIWSVIYIQRFVSRRKSEIYAEQESKKKKKIIVLDGVELEKPPINLKELNNHKKELKKKLAISVYYGEIDGEVCGVTNRKLEMKDDIVKCPNCGAYFRLQNLIIEMMEDEVCPKCREDIF